MFGFWKRSNDYRTPDWKQREGTANWCEDTSDLSGMFRPPWRGWDAIPLGVNKPQGTKGPLWNTQVRQGHGLCFAPNRIGKGASVIIPALLTYGGSMLVIDPKGENAWVTAEHRRRMGQRTVILDPWDEVNRFGGVQGKQGAEKTTKYNPLSFLSRFSPSFSDDIDALAHSIIITPPGTKDPHWPDAARAYVAGIIALVKEAFGKTHRDTLGEVRRYLTAGPDVVLRLAEEVKRNLPESLAVRELGRFFRETDEVSGIISGALTQTEFLKSAPLQSAMENDYPIFELDDFVSKPTTLYLVLPPDKLLSHSRWLRMILTLALKAIVRAPERQDLPVMMLIDEMGTIGPLPSLESAFGLLAGYNVRFFGFLQSLSQLKKDYPNGWSNFLDNCSVLQVLAAKGETAEHFSNMIGTQTIRQGHASGMVFSWTQHRRPLIFGHEIATLLGEYPDQPWNNTQLVIYPQGGLNVRTLQNPYFRQPGWSGIYRKAPQFNERDDRR